LNWEVILFFFVGPQIPTATSQQMDDLFDILIESGGEFVILLYTTSICPQLSL